MKMTHHVALRELVASNSSSISCPYLASLNNRSSAQGEAAGNSFRHLSAAFFPHQRSAALQQQQVISIFVSYPHVSLCSSSKSNKDV
jgi:hypothetical protein